MILSQDTVGTIIMLQNDTESIKMKRNYTKGINLYLKRKSEIRANRKGYEMKKRLQKYSVFFDLLLGLNFVCVVSVALGAAISDGDAKIAIIISAINVFMVLLCRLSDKGGSDAKQTKM